MKIAILAPVFDSRLNYNETLLARAFAKLGHEVCIFTSSDPVFDDLPRDETSLPYTIRRTDNYLKIKGTYYLLGRRNIRELEAYRADVVLAMVPDRGLTAQYLKANLSNAKVVSYFGDLAVNTKRPRLKRFLKSRWYNRAVAKSDLFAVVSPETKEIISRFSKDILPVWVSGLPFDSEVFYCDKKALAELEELRNRVNHVVSIVTRVNSTKPMVLWLSQLESILDSKEGVGVVIAGLGEDIGSNQLRNYIETKSYSNRVILMPLLDEKSLRMLYAGVDLSIWFQASIGIQQSLACGVPVVVPNEFYLSHLIQEGENSISYETESYPEGGVSKAVEKAINVEWDKENVIKTIQRYEKMNIAKEILVHLEKKS